MKVGLDHKKLKALRKQRNLTQEQLAELLHISDRHLRNLESTCVNPSSSTLQQLSQTLDVPMPELMTTSVDS